MHVSQRSRIYLPRTRRQPGGAVCSATTASIDAAAEKALADSGAPSVSIAVVKDGRVAYVHAYGKARLQPDTAAQPEAL